MIHAVASAFTWNDRSTSLPDGSTYLARQRFPSPCFALPTREPNLPCFGLVQGVPSPFNLIYGDTESGKTWLCLAAVASVLHDGGTATIIDLDHNGAPALIGNLIKLGVDAEILQDPRRFRLSEPGDRLDLVEVVQDQAVAKPDVVILDSLGEILPLFRANSNSADDFTTVHAGNLGPTGTAAKLRATDGIAVRVGHQASSPLRCQRPGGRPPREERRFARCRPGGRPTKRSPPTLPGGRVAISHRFV